MWCNVRVTWMRSALQLPKDGEGSVIRTGRSAIYKEGNMHAAMRGCHIDTIAILQIYVLFAIGTKIAYDREKDFFRRFVR